MSKIARESALGLEIDQSETFADARRSGKYWVLVPLALIAALMIVILETTALNLFTAPPNLALEQVVDIPLAGGPSRFGRVRRLSCLRRIRAAVFSSTCFLD